MFPACALFHGDTPPHRAKILDLPKTNSPVAFRPARGPRHSLSSAELFPVEPRSLDSVHSISHRRALVRSGYQFFRRIMKLHRFSRDAHPDRGMGASGLRNLVWPTSNTNTPAFFARTQRLPSRSFWILSQTRSGSPLSLPKTVVLSPSTRHSSRIAARPKRRFDCVREGADGAQLNPGHGRPLRSSDPRCERCFVDRLDEVPVEKAKTSPQQSASPAQPREIRIPPDLMQVIECTGGGGRTRTYDLRIMRPSL